MDLFELAMRLVTEGEAEMSGALTTISGQGHEAAGALEEVQQGWQGMIGPLLELIAIWEGAEIFRHMIEEAGELAIKLERTSQMTGISAERLAELGEAAELSYVPVDQLQTAFRRLSISLTDMQSKGAEAMTVMGLNVQSFHGDADAALSAIAEKFASFRDDAHKSALAIEIFGRGGLAMIPLLNNLAATTKAVKDLGETMTTEQKASMLDYEQAMIRLKITADGFSRTVAAEAAPALTALAEAFTVTIREGQQFNVVGEVLAGTIRFLGTLVIALKTGFMEVANVLSLVGATVWNTATTIEKAIMHMHDPAQATADLKAGLAKQKSIWDDFRESIVKDAEEASEQLSSLYGLDDKGAGPDGPRHLGAAKKKPSAPTIPNKDLLNDWLKIYNKALAEAYATMKAQYDLAVKIAEDEDTITEQKYAKIKSLDDKRLEEVIVIYGRESKEYYEQLKVMEEHEHQHQQAIKKEKEWGAEQARQVDRQLAEFHEKAEHERLRQIKEYVNAAANTVEQTLAAAFKKGATVGSVLTAFGDTMLQGLGGIFVRMGTTLLESAPIFEMIRAGLSNIFTAPESFAIGGAALIALGSVLNAIGSGGGSGAGGAGAAAYGGAPPASYPTQIVFGQNSATSAAGMTAQPPMNVTIIGPNDPTAQRQIKELLRNADRRGG